MLLSRLRETVRSAQVLTAPEDTAAYLTDWRGRFTGRAQAVVLPSNTHEVAAIVSVCAEMRTPIVPQGGNTGLAGGATPDPSGDAIVLSLKRLNRVREIDPINGTITVEAGCVLHDVQQAAYGADGLFPLSLAAEGSATIGGNLSTNAGGTQVLRYGNARELALGLEVVLPSGEIWSGLRGLRKDNTGYDLRDLFIGAEGTLGVITAACLKTFPLPRSQVTALFALDSVSAALSLLPLAQSTAGPTLTAFEFFSIRCLQLVTRHFPQQRSPFERAHAQYVLLELSDHEDERHARSAVAIACRAGIGKRIDRRRGHCAIGCARAFAMDAARIDLRSPGTRRQEHQARYIGADFVDRALHRRDRRTPRSALSRHPHGDLRPSGRRQPALQRDATGGDR